jgi:hypothetical protein
VWAGEGVRAGDGEREEGTGDGVSAERSISCMRGLRSEAGWGRATIVSLFVGTTVSRFVGTTVSLFATTVSLLDNPSASSSSSSTASRRDPRLDARECVLAGSVYCGGGLFGTGACLGAAFGGRGGLSSSTNDASLERLDAALGARLRACCCDDADTALRCDVEAPLPLRGRGGAYTYCPPPGLPGSDAPPNDASLGRRGGAAGRQTEGAGLPEVERDRLPFEPWRGSDEVRGTGVMTGAGCGGCG